MHRWSQLFIPTLREAPSDAEVASHKFLIRAGYIRQLAAGIYDYLFLGNRAVLRIIDIIRDEMDKIGQEFLLPTLHPRELWEASGLLPGIPGGLDPAVAILFPFDYRVNCIGVPVQAQVSRVPFTNIRVGCGYLWKCLDGQTYVGGATYGTLLGVCPEMVNSCPILDVTATISTNMGGDKWMRNFQTNACYSFPVIP